MSRKHQFETCSVYCMNCGLTMTEIVAYGVSHCGWTRRYVNGTISRVYTTTQVAELLGIPIPMPQELTPPPSGG